MKGTKLVLLIVAVLVLGGGVAACNTYNRFTAQEVGVDAAWSEVENQLQRRSDLIPNLVETVKGFAQQERDVFQAVADARAKMAGAGTPQQRIDAANAESSALARLLVVVENYPQLKSDAQFMNLQHELAGTENRLATVRRRYNETAQPYNTALRRFPGNIFASMFGFAERPFFTAPDDAKANPKVDFNRGK